MSTENDTKTEALELAESRAADTMPAPGDPSTPAPTDASPPAEDDDSEPTSQDGPPATQDEIDHGEAIRAAFAAKDWDKFNALLKARVAATTKAES